jgi:hypothetical protein
MCEIGDFLVVTICTIMDQNKKHQLREVQRRDEILTINEFDFLFFRLNTLPREGVVILKL